MGSSQVDGGSRSMRRAVLRAGPPAESRQRGPLQRSTSKRRRLRTSLQRRRSPASGLPLRSMSEKTRPPCRPDGSGLSSALLRAPPDNGDLRRTESDPPRTEQASPLWYNRISVRYGGVCQLLCLPGVLEASTHEGGRPTCLGGFTVSSPAPLRDPWDPGILITCDTPRPSCGVFPP
jgi:hypothetical protein